MERRFRPLADGLPRIPCRACLAAVDIDPARIELLDGHWLLRCPTCDRQFPVRQEDALAGLRDPLPN